eukprot:TRINITY_DN7289_c0_g1_i2.p1 TRINITY_DN7289_c0_g1~~TRINITY_DN7289_c0_g1_i2.p1  ORF type:complete len:702 (+),score=170.07 TRINITY_DN7289_c0_g1_i2:118-2106(+)
MSERLYLGAEQKSKSLDFVLCFGNFVQDENKRDGLVVDVANNVTVAWMSKIVISSDQDTIVLAPDIFNFTEPSWSSFKGKRVFNPGEVIKLKKSNFDYGVILDSSRASGKLKYEIFWVSRQTGMYEKRTAPIPVESVAPAFAFGNGSLVIHPVSGGKKKWNTAVFGVVLSSGNEFVQVSNDKTVIERSVLTKRSSGKVITESKPVKSFQELHLGQRVMLDGSCGNIIRRKQKNVVVLLDDLTFQRSDPIAQVKATDLRIDSSGQSFLLDPVVSRWVAQQLEWGTSYFVDQAIRGFYVHSVGIETESLPSSMDLIFPLKAVGYVLHKRGVVGVLSSENEYDQSNISLFKVVHLPIFVHVERILQTGEEMPVSIIKKMALKKRLELFCYALRLHSLGGKQDSLLSEKQLFIISLKYLLRSYLLKKSKDSNVIPRNIVRSLVLSYLAGQSLIGLESDGFSSWNDLFCVCMSYLSERSFCWGSFGVLCIFVFAYQVQIVSTSVFSLASQFSLIEERSKIGSARDWIRLDFFALIFMTTLAGNLYQGDLLEKEGEIEFYEFIGASLLFKLEESSVQRILDECKEMEQEVLSFSSDELTESWANPPLEKISFPFDDDDCVSDGKEIEASTYDNVEEPQLAAPEVKENDDDSEGSLDEFDPNNPWSALR